MTALGVIVSLLAKVVDLCLFLGLVFVKGFSDKLSSKVSAVFCLGAGYCQRFLFCLFFSGWFLSKVCVFCCL